MRLDQAREGAPARWSAAVIALHWLAAALILILIALGLAMVHANFDAGQKFDLYQLHKSLGFVTLAAMALHLAARLATRAPPIRGARWEHRLAGFTQASLYTLTFAAILAGWLLVSASPLPIPTRIFNLFVMPNIARPNPALFEAAIAAHRYIAWLIGALVGLHVAGALKHHLLDRDDVLRRMASGLGARR